MKVRKIIQKYKVPKEELHLCPPIKLSESPKFIPLDSFYSVLRNRVKDYLHENKLKQGPNMMTLVSFWITLAIWIGSIALTLKYQTVPFAIFQGFCGAILGAYGHNFIHQPGYMNYARISLDTIGFSSQGWYREHVLQHHMYTNTPLDNHFHGMKPFIQTDPTVNRNLFEKICALGNPIVLWFGLPGNYVIHLLEMMRGREDITLGKAFLPGLIYLFCKVCGWKRGCMLMFVQAGFLGVHYFTMALMNHNAEHCVNTEARNGANDWGVAQLHRKFMTLYKEMVGTFMSPMSLASEVNCYNSHL
ncbi:hypothetical protein ScalyP_jg1660 [Parmales sp. scaly parma]|nr:hypothetical protein ScalyP_jg1660 [Parmales sp. scaly parma]